MYEFTDPNSTAAGGTLPSEAVSVNGVYIENVIEGYRTLTVSAREAFDMNYSENKIGNNLYLQDYYQDSRIIEVEYQLTAATPEEFIQRCNLLNGILNFKEAKIQFADEQDKYYIGTKTSSEPPPKGRLNITSTFQIYCPDPHKYSITTKQFKAALNANGILEATVVNEGSAAVPIDYTIRHKHDNGYIGIVSEHGALQLGKIDEADLAPYKGNQVLINTDTWTEFKPDTDLYPGHPGGGTANGSLKLSTLNNENVLILSDPGTGEGLHGGLMTADIPVDSDGKGGAVNFDCRFDVFFEALAASQTGLMSISFIDENGGLIFCLVYKKDSNGVYAPINMYAGGMKIQEFYDGYNVMRLYDKDTDVPVRRPFRVLKEGAKITGYYSSVGKSILVPELENAVCDKIQVFIGKYGSRAMVTRTCFQKIVFQKMGVKLWSDVPNRYPNGSTVNIDGNEGKIYTDGILRMDDEVKGSQYFLAPPGETKVQFFHSDFSVPYPDVTAEIREGWL